MNGLALKLLAAVTMFIDHFAASCGEILGMNQVQILGTSTTLYWFCRMVGRVAFPIYCFQIVEGVYHTRNWKRYALRLGALAALSELPFDFALFDQKLDFDHQNVFFTLFFGMILVVVMRKWSDAVWSGKYVTGKLQVLCYVLKFPVIILLTMGVGLTAKYLLKTDYGFGGVVMIVVMSLIYEPWNHLAPWIPVNIIRIIGCALGIWACIWVLDNQFERYALYCLIAIGLYNGKKGYSAKWIQQAFYFFYPVHLIILAVLAWYLKSR